MGRVRCGSASRRAWPRGLTRFVGRRHGAGGPAPGPGAGRGRTRARSWRWWGRLGWGSRAWSTSSSTPTTRRAGWCWRAPRCRTARPRPTSPCSTCCRRYAHVDERDDTRTIRAKVTGQVLTLDETLQDDDPAAAGAAGRPAGGQSVPDARSAATAPAHARRRSSACCCARARCSRCSWSVRTCTGSIPRRRPCSTAWSRACPRPACCSWSTIARSTSTAGAARPTTRNSGSTRCRPASADALLAGPAGGRSQPGAAHAAPDRAHRGQSLLSGGERAHPGGDRGAGRRARGLSPGAGAADHSGAGHGAGGAGSAHRPAAARGETPAPDGRGHWHGGALAPAAGHCRAARGRRCTAASPTSRPPSSSTRRACSRSTRTPSSTP